MIIKIDVKDANATKYFFVSVFIKTWVTIIYIPLVVVEIPNSI